MNLYHATTPEAARSILADGFEDATGYYLTSQLWTGVWLSDKPLDPNEGAKGCTLIVLEMPESILAPYEWIEEGKPFREFLVPAEIINRYRPFTLDED